MRDLHLHKSGHLGQVREAEFVLDLVDWSKVRPILCGIPSSEQDHFGCPGGGVGLRKFSILKGFFLDIDFEFVF